MENKYPIISSWHMIATLEFLESEVPDLCHHIRAIGRQPQMEPGAHNRGETEFAQYELNMRPEDASAICEALGKGLQRFSEDREFSAIRLDSLIELWKGYAATLRGEI